MKLSRERPFPGLRPFDTPDREFFFGRDEQTFALYRLLDRSRFVAVVGSSGSGKSSLVRAGLLPLLDDETNEESGVAWSFATLHPGDDPIGELAKAIASFNKDHELDAELLTQDIADALRGSSFGLSQAIEAVPGLSGRNVLLVVDQFEELFRYAGRRDDATNFVQLLLEATRSYSSTIHVLLTMRSDFIGDCAQFQRLPEAVSAAQFLVPSLSRDQREQVIRRPIELAGGAIESLLVERLLNDGSSEMDQLPVLQHCLARLWECAPVADGVHRLGITEYDSKEIGGIAHALSEHADRVMKELGPQLKPVVESVFRALSATDSDGRATRRALTFAELIAETGADEADLRTVIDRFRKEDCSFLVTSVPLSHRLAPETRIDVVHEALLRRWDAISAAPSLKGGERVSGWLAAEAADGWEYRALLNLVKHDSGGVKVTLPLDQVESRNKWWTSRTRTPAWAARYGGGFELVEALFADSLAALAAHREAERQAEVAAREQAEREEERRRADAYGRMREQFMQARVRRTRIALAIMAVLAIFAIGSAAWALATAQRLRHAENQLLAQNRTLSSQKLALTQQSFTLRSQAGALGVQAGILRTDNAQLKAKEAKIAAADARMTATDRELSQSLANLNVKDTQLATLRAADGDANKCSKLIDAGDYQGALTYCRSALQKNPKLAYAMREQAMTEASIAQKSSNTPELRMAKQDIAKAIGMAPRDAQNWLLLCAVNYMMKDYAAVPGDCGQALALDSSLSSSYYWLGKTAYARNCWSIAVAAFSRRIDSDPSDFAAFYWRGRSRAESGASCGKPDAQDLAGAVADFSYLLERDPQEYGGDANSYDAHYWRGVAEYLNQDQKAAVVDFTQALLQSNGADDYARYWRGKAELATQKYAQAADDLQHTGRFQLNQYWLAVAYFYTNDYARAAESLSAYLKKFPQDPDGYRLLGKVQLSRGDFAAARASAVKAKELYTSESDRASAQRLIDVIAGIQGDPELRDRYLADSKALASNPRDAQALVDRGDVYETLDRQDYAIADYGAALTANPQLAYAYASRCESEREIASTKSDYTDALNDCNAAIKIDPHDAYALRERGLTELDLTDMTNAEAAAADTTSAIALDAQHASYRLARCRVYLGTDRFGEAIEDCSAAIKLDPKGWLAYYYRAQARLHSGEYADGIADVQSYLQQYPDSAHALILQARLEAGLGNGEKAKSLANQALQIFTQYQNKDGIDEVNTFLSSLVSAQSSETH